jgi:amino acid transporter
MTMASPSAEHGTDHGSEKGRIGTIEGLAGLSLDALTSVAYGPEAIVLVLAASGAGAIKVIEPVTVAIVVLLVILVFSYRQVIAAYPDGGGAYAVSKENLGRMPSLLAGASLVIDYVLTVAVSITAGVAAFTSAYPSTASDKVPLCLGLLALLTGINMMGISESARAFLLPTLVFIGGLYAVVLFGLLDPLGHAPPRANSLPGSASAVGILLVLKAFASGCSALTGVEAIANGTPSFKQPRIKRAQRTEVLLGLILGSLLLGLAGLTVRFHLRPQANVTLLSQIADRSLGHGFGYYVVELSTTLALALAANTSFGGLPVLGSLLARDNYLPHVFALHGERPVYRYGVGVLAALAAVLIAASDGNTQSLIPLFAIGVFIGFTLSQAGLVKHWFTERGPGWVGRSLINGTGALLTAAASIIFLASKFVHGAFVVVVAIPLLIVLFLRIRSYYDRLADELGLGELPPRPSPAGRSLTLVPVVTLSKTTTFALNHALSHSREVRAVHVDIDADTTRLLQEQWDRWSPGIELVTLPSPKRSIVKPFLAYMGSAEVASHGEISVLIPEVEPRKLAHRLLLNKRGAILATVLRRRTDAVVATIPYRLD